MRAAGLLRPRPGRYAVLVAGDLVAFFGIWAALYWVGPSWWALVLAIPAAIFTTRLLFIGHDVGHGQLARAPRLSRALGVLVGDLMSGMSAHRWIDKHNRHHAHPNEVGRDPDVGMGALVWTYEHASQRHGRLGQWLARHQGQLFFPMLLGEAFNLRIAGFRAVRSWRHLLPLLAHAAAYVGFLLATLGPSRAAVFALVHQALLGLHLGCAFAPNHKDMPMASAERKWDFLRRQVLTSRNVSGGPAVHWFLGGLNYQIEHHLFPSMPRLNLRKAQPIVRRYCARLGVPYAEESLRHSLLLTVRHLQSVHQPAGAARGTGTMSATVAGQ